MVLRFNHGNFSLNILDLKTVHKASQTGPFSAQLIALKTFRKETISNN
jgi:hypothetical protein